MSALSQLASMHNVSAEKRFAAVMIADAVAEAKAGDISATAWLTHCAPAWLSYVCPDDVDPGAVHQALLATLPAVGATGIRSLMVQLDLFTLEAA